MRKQEKYLPELLFYISLANCIPEFINFPSYKTICDRIDKKDSESESELDFEEELIKGYKDWFNIFPYDQLPKEIYNLIFDGEFKDLESQIVHIIEVIDLLVSVDHGITVLAFAVTNEKFHNQPILETIKESEYYMMDNADYSSINLSVDKDGYIQIKTNKFLDFIRDNKIEARRVRACIVCGWRFWAYRLDKWTCSKPCGNIFRQRHWQKENKEEYNEKRRTNYAYKKSVTKQKEGKKNGTL